jgi:hypothetical protein
VCTVGNARQTRRDCTIDRHLAAKLRRWRFNVTGRLQAPLSLNQSIKRILGSRLFGPEYRPRSSASHRSSSSYGPFGWLLTCPLVPSQDLRRPQLLKAQLATVCYLLKASAVRRTRLNHGLRILIVAAPELETIDSPFPHPDPEKLLIYKGVTKASQRRHKGVIKAS